MTQQYPSTAVAVAPSMDDIISHRKATPALDPNRPVVLALSRVNLHPVVIRQDFVCIEGTGGAVWRPSIQFAKFMCGPEGPRCLPLAGKAVLEISSGLGLGAIVAWHLGASPVVS